MERSWVVWMEHADRLLYYTGPGGRPGTSCWHEDRARAALLTEEEEAQKVAEDNSATAAVLPPEAPPETPAKERGLGTCSRCGRANTHYTLFTGPVCGSCGHWC